MMPLLVESARTAITTNGGSKEPWVTQLAVKPFTWSPSATPQMKTPCGILRNKVFLAAASRVTVLAMGGRGQTGPEEQR